MIGTRRITRRSFLAAAGLAAVGASLSLTGCSGSVSDGLSSKHLLVAHSHSEAHPVNVGLQKMTEVASAESDLTFSVYPNGQLGDNAAMIQLVKAGVLDIAKVSASSMEQFNSAYAIFSMPYVFESTEQYFAVMNQSEAVQEIFKSTYDQGFFAIGWFDSGSRSIYTTKDGPCEGPADLKGLKIRTQDSPTSIAMIRAMGGSATKHTRPYGRIWCRRTLTVPRRWASSSTPSTRRPLSRLPSPCATSSVPRAPTMLVITRTSCPMYRLDEEGSIPC